MIIEKECRICLEKDKIDEFINPCLCMGTSKWVHSSCLNKWRQINIHSKPYKQCMECNYKYKFTTIIELETYKTNINRNLNVIINIGIYIASFVFGYIFYLLDYLNHLDTIKILSYNNNNLINTTNILLSNDTFCFLIYYNTLTLSFYFNVQLLYFFIYTLSKISRKRLYLYLIGKKYLFNVLCFNYIYYLYAFFGMNDFLETYYIISPIMQIFLFRLQITLYIKHDKVIDNMNTKYNNQELLNYVNEEDIEEEEEIAIIDETNENLELALLSGETKNNINDFDSIEID
tara:strand:- start:843 stop:1709 length:867 start_codon:yes stop_codon:yes gene_type:complete